MDQSPPTRWHEMEVVSTLKTLLMSNSSILNESVVGGRPPLDSDIYRHLVAEFKDTLFTHREFRTIVLICLYIPIFLMAFSGNVLVLLVVCLHRHMRSVTNCFILNLAVADILVTVVCVPMAIGQGIYKLWVYGEFMCKLTTYMQGVTVAASVFTLMALSVDRFLAIRHPMAFRRLSAGSHAWKVAMVTWLTAFLIMVPLLLVRKLDVVRDLLPTEPLYFCAEVWNEPKHRQIYDVFLFVFMFILPGVFIGVSYAMIGKQLWTEGSQFYRLDSKVGRVQAERVMAGRRRVARMLIILAIVFGICWMPCHLLGMFLAFVDEPRGTGALEAWPFTILLGHSNSAFNPVLYCFLNKSFRRCTARMLHCKEPRKKKKKKQSQETPVNLVVCYSKMNGAMKTSVHFSRRPIRRVFSNSSTNSRSTSGSLRFSRSTNASSLKTRPTMVDTSKGAGYFDPKRSPPVIAVDQPSLRDSMAAGNHDEVYPSITIQHHDEAAAAAAAAVRGREHRALARQRREIFNYTLSIPTTINEESSRVSRTPSPTVDRGATSLLRSLAENSDEEQASDVDYEMDGVFDDGDDADDDVDDDDEDDVMGAEDALIRVNVHDAYDTTPSITTDSNATYMNSSGAAPSSPGQQPLRIVVPRIITTESDDYL